jgi:primosomal protein N' (replication factor Y) (superfamily II helicase)
MNQAILNIAIDVPLNRLFDYLNNGANVRIGQRVLVPFGSRTQIGVVMGLRDRSDVPIEKLKPILEAFTDEVPIDTETIALIKFAADYYQYPFGQALLSALPARLRQTAPATTRKQFAYQLTEAGLAKTVDDIPKRQLVTQRVLVTLSQEKVVTEARLAEISSSAKKAIKQLIAQDWVSQIEIEKTPRVLKSEPAALPILNAEQQTLVETLIKGAHTFNAWLLHGITGSGKTEVYMRLMHAVLNQNAKDQAQILVLVPEINLTPQLEARFKQRFPNHVFVSLHSHLSESERLHHWQLAQSGAAQIIVGTRLSVFTPMPNLKLIIIDEEHDSSYKQQDSMRYHARDIALVRAKKRNIPIILGSATPALESWFNAQAQSDQPAKYQLLSLNSRAVTAAKLPHIACIDTTKVNLQHGLTPQLIAALKLRLARKEQSLLFINRRGFSPVLLCAACHWIAPCARCSSRLVVHLGQKRLRCHHCGHDEAIPKQCPNCGDADLKPTGFGTQRLEQSLAQLLPEARIARVDRDSTSHKYALVDILDRVNNQEVDILVGTQMLAKGHDFPNLTLVGVIDTDSALHSPDFRASERLFAQLMQVAGRAGRADKAGQVIIQTQFPDHALFNALRRQDYGSFANNQLKERQEVQFPPFVFTALIRAEANDYSLVHAFLNHAFNLAYGAHKNVMVYDAVRPQMERLKGMERGYLLLHATQRTPLQRVLKAVVEALRNEKIAQKVRWAVDVDPLEF